MGKAVANPWSQFFTSTSPSTTAAMAGSLIHGGNSVRPPSSSGCGKAAKATPARPATSSTEDQKKASFSGSSRAAAAPNTQ